MDKKVLLIYPPSLPVVREDRCQIPQKNAAINSVFPPTDLMYLAAIAEKCGCVCRIVDYSLDNKKTSDFKKDLLEFKPDYLLVSVTTPTLEGDLEACVFAGEHAPQAKIIVKGAHFLEFNKEILEKFPQLDLIIRGEAEAVFGQIVSGTPLEQIPGIIWRSEQGIRDNPGRQFVRDLDSLPYPARHLVNNLRYRRPDNGHPQALIKVARGCPYNCFFCLAAKVSGEKIRLRSPAGIVKEIELCIKDYGIKDFIFFAENFTADKAWVLELCRSITQAGLKINWSTNSRLDTIDAQTAQAMRAAGCTLVSVGIESGSPLILEKIGKNYPAVRIPELFSVFKKAGLRTVVYYIIGFPWDTPQTVEETVSLSLNLGSDYAAFYVAVPFPGTRFFEYARQNKLLEPGNAGAWADAYYYPAARGHFLSKEEIVRLHRRAVRKFYLRPKYIASRFLGLRSWRELYCQGRLAFFTVVDHCSYLRHKK